MKLMLQAPRIKILHHSWSIKASTITQTSHRGSALIFVENNILRRLSKPVSLVNHSSVHRTTHRK
jgi:hypothetical protein